MQLLCVNSLKRRHIILIFRFSIVFWVTTRKGIHALMLKKLSVLILSSALSEMHCFDSCIFKALLQSTQTALIGQLTHA